MKTILLTGSNGLLGQKLVAGLRGRNDVRLIATSLGENRVGETSGYTYRPLDVTDPAAVTSLFEEFGPQTVIHTAAMTQVDECQKDQKACRNFNVDAVAHLIHACEKKKTHLIHLSTDYVFDGKNGPYREDDRPNPLDRCFYGQSKLDSEELVRKSRIPWSIIRTILIYGVAEKRRHPNIVLWAVESLKKGEKIRAVKDEVRSPTLAEDLAAGCIAAALNGRTGIYHVSGPDQISVFDFVKLIAEVFNLNPELIEPTTSGELNRELGRPAERPLKTGFVIKKARRELDYRPHSLREGLGLVKKQRGA